jgi:hypothetical protein
MKLNKARGLVTLSLAAGLGVGLFATGVSASAAPTAKLATISAGAINS